MLIHKYTNMSVFHLALKYAHLQYISYFGIPSVKSTSWQAHNVHMQGRKYVVYSDMLFNKSELLKNNN